VRPSISPSASASASDWRLVVIGDSVATAGAGSETTSYGHLFAKAIRASTGKTVSVSVLGADTTDQVLGGLADGGRFADAVADADIVVVTVGANEIDPFGSFPKGTCAVGTTAAHCLAAVNPKLESRFDAILTRIAALAAGRPVAVRVTSPDYNPLIGWSDAPTPTFGLDFYRQVADAYTEVVCRLAPKHGAKCADFLHTFNGPDGSEDAAPFLAPDHHHPSLAGRQAIADVLMKVGLEPLR
jgi:lysophospholipase L1-like esterase